jgi:uncharacterized cupin superfamily protein
MELSPEDTNEKRLAVETALADLGFGGVMSIAEPDEQGFKTQHNFVLSVKEGIVLEDMHLRLGTSVLEEGGFRVVRVQRDADCVTFETYRSERTAGTVQRAAQRGSDMLIVLQGRIHVVPNAASRDLDTTLLTKAGDEVVFWSDVQGDWVPMVSKFENLTVRRLLHM